MWRAALGARGLRPNAARVLRAIDKLGAPGALLVVAELDSADGVAHVVGSALGEPGRLADGAGALEPGLLQLSMLFVLPARQRLGIGSALVEGIADAAWLRGYRRLQVWARADDTPTRALYDACGLELSGNEQDLDGPAVQYVAELEPPVRDLLVTADGLRLGQLLKLAGLAQTGAQAKDLLGAGQVQVDGEVELRRGRQLVDGEVVTTRDQSVRLVLAHGSPSGT